MRRGTTSLFGYRDYTLLWIGQTFSLTGSAAKAGIVSFASLLPYVVFQLPAGALVDRWHRKWTMAACDALRAAALASVAVALALGQLVYWQLVIVAFVERTLTILFAPAETAALSRI